MTGRGRLQAVRGMRDILPDESPAWRRAETLIAEVLAQYAYRELRLPLVEATDVFARALGQETDVVSKEMYSFVDRNGDSLTLRPEGTAGAVRAVLEHGLIHNQNQRLWYVGPMFRHERPQKGRQRQFHQLGVEAYGFAGPDIDAELILLCERIWRRLGIQGLRLEINSLGAPAARQAYRDKLTAYFTAHRRQLDADSQRRLQHNPLRILDSKNPELAPLIAAAPGILEHLDAESEQHFDKLLQLLTAAKIDYQVNPRLMRGLDYYEKTVFEWVGAGLGSQTAVCAGGRYDGLVARSGGRDTPALGLAMGMERLLAMAPPAAEEGAPVAPHIYLVCGGASPAPQVLLLAERLRDEVPGLRVLPHCGGGSLKSQFRKADKSGAELALMLGDEVSREEAVVVKFLRREAPQATLPLARLPDFLATCLAI